MYSVSPMDGLVVGIKTNAEATDDTIAHAKEVYAFTDASASLRLWLLPSGNGIGSLTVNGIIDGIFGYWQPLEGHIEFHIFQQGFIDYVFRGYSRDVGPGSTFRPAVQVDELFAMSLSQPMMIEVRVRNSAMAGGRYAGREERVYSRLDGQLEFKALDAENNPVAFQVMPEPGSIWLTGGALLLGLALFRKRRERP